MSVSRYFLGDHGSLSGWIAYQTDDYSALIMNLLYPKQNELILDNGAGNGRFSIAMAENGARVISLDINKRILRSAAESLKQKRLNDRAELILGDIQNLPFKDDVFDRVLCVHNLWYVSDYKKAVDEMFRTLKNEGKVIADHLNLFNRHVFSGGLIYAIVKIFRRNPTPLFLRTPQQILSPFTAFETEVFSLFLKPGRRLSAKRGTSLWAPRLIVRSSKSIRRVLR